MTTYISPSLPGMIRNLWKSDPSERSVRTALNLAGDLIQELIDLRDQPAERHDAPNADAPTDADTGGIPAEPSDAEIEAVALEFERHEQFLYGDDDQPSCECGFRLEEAPNGSPMPSLRMHQARAALLAAREAARHE